MFELVSECAEDFVAHLSRPLADRNKIDIEIKDLFSRYTNDVIASCAFGLKVNSFANPTNEFFMNGQILVNLSSIGMLFKILLITKMPWLARILNVALASIPIAQSFRSIILDTMAVRKCENIHRPDIVNALMQIRERGLNRPRDENENEVKDGFAAAEVGREWTDDELEAQCFFFFVAGFETSSTTLTFIAYELILNPDMQQRLYEEIANVNGTLDGKRPTYDAIQKMPYLDQFINETMRKWPALALLDRVCV